MTDVVALEKMSQPALVRFYSDARSLGDIEAERAAGAEIRRRREAKEMPVAPQPPAPQSKPERSDLPPLILQRASDIAPRGVKWIWDARLPAGQLSLLAGREGLGKSTIAATIAAQLTRGTLPGESEGTPRGVFVSATEDSWEHTIVPRLMAAGADLGRVYRMTFKGTEALLTLPGEIDRLHEMVENADDIALVILDPLMSRLGSLDSHKDAEVRQALEPLVGFADSTGAAVLGLIHFNKSAGVDALTAIMGSRAFVAVARSVLVAVRDGDAYVFGHAKSNLGRRVDAEGYDIDGVKVAQDGGDDIWTSAIRWTGPTDRTVEEIHEGAGDVSAVDEAAGWLADFLSMHGGEKASQIVKDAARKGGHNERTLARARKRLGVESRNGGTVPRSTVWHLPEERRTVPPGAGTSASRAASPPSGTSGTSGTTGQDTLL